MAIALFYVAGGALLALAMLRLDIAIGATNIPGWLRSGEQSARALVSGLATSFLFVVAIVFLVRISSLQLNKDSFSSRILRQFLTDRVQRNVMGFIIGALTYVVAVVRAVPYEHGGVEAVPHLSVAVACVLAVAAALAIVFAVHDASGWGQTGRLIRRLTDDCVSVIRSTHPERGQTNGEASLACRPSRRGPGEAQPPVVNAYDSGWVARIDEDALLASVPPGSTVALAVRVGVFVVEGTPVYSVSVPDGESPGEDGKGVGIEGVAKAIVIGTDPTLEENVGYGISQLTDIAGEAIARVGGGSTTAQEVVLYIGVILRELLLRDLPAPCRLGDEGRCLMRPEEQSLDGYVTSAFDRIRVAGSGSPGLTACLLSTIEMLIAALEGAGLSERTEALHRQARLVVAGAERDIAVPQDLEQIRHQALDHQLLV